jgi:polysaccharide pyruvyl transferase WcaK-like protein
VRTIFCIHPHGFNVGNHAIHLALRGMLDRTFGELVNLVSIPATTRFESHGRAGLSAGVIHEINQYADGVIVGGGNLFENGQLDVDTTALRALEPPMMIFSCSRGRIHNRHGRLVDRTDVMPDAIIRALHEQATIAVARDRATFEHLEAIGCPRQVLGGCPTITLGDDADRLPSIPASDREAVLLSIRTPELMNIPLDARARVREQVTALASLVAERTGVVPRLLCHDHRDIPFAASFTDLEYVWTGDVTRFLGLLREARLCVSFRLHAALPCLAMGTPFINISYDERSASAMQTMGLGDWDVPLLGDDPVAAVARRFDDLADLPALVRRTEPGRDHLREVMDDAFVRFHAAVEAARSRSGAPAVASVEIKPGAGDLVRPRGQSAA